MTTVNQVIDGSLIQKGVVSITTDTTLNSSHSGKILQLVANAAADYIVLLPAVANSTGLKYKFFYKTNQAHTITIRAASASIIGILSAPTQGTIPLVLSTDLVCAAGLVAGATIDMWCDGVNWIANVMSTANVGITRA